MQVLKLTDAQIDKTLNYFEGGQKGPKPKGVKLAESFTKTMGRFWSWDGGKEGLVATAY